MKYFWLFLLGLFCISCQTPSPPIPKPENNENDRFQIKIILNQIESGPHYPLRKVAVMEIGEDEEYCLLVVKNRTDAPFDFFLSGPTHRMIKIKEKMTEEISLSPGEYLIGNVFESKDRVPGFCEGKFQKGGRYHLSVHYPDFID